ncbi:MAG: prolyl oligopeptidase family serine peptidase [Bacteroidetes bacterium]|nr:prolyl oligopeptidase family serine peptidase [Bacteroidota bacterium]
MNTSLLVSKTAPISSTESGSYPALIFLHGRGTDENDLLELAEYLDPRLLIAGVRAPYTFSYGGYTWFDLDDNGTVDIDQVIKSRDSFLDWFEYFKNQNPVDPKRIFLFGFSMGAMMSLALSLSYPRLFKGVIAHSGLLLQNERLCYKWDDLKGLSFLIAHGSNDPIVPVEFGRETFNQLKKKDIDVIYKEYPIQHSISDRSIFDISAWLKKQI